MNPMALAQTKSVLIKKDDNLGSVYQNWKVLQLSCDNLSPFEKPRPRVLSIILDSPILSAMEVSILKIDMISSMLELKSQNLKISSKCWYHGDTEVVRFSIISRFGKLPEFVIMVLWSYQGGDHGECSELLNYFKD